MKARDYSAERYAAQRAERDRARREQDLAVQKAERERLLLAYDGDADAMFSDWKLESVKQGLGIGRYGRPRRRRATYPPKPD